MVTPDFWLELEIWPFACAIKMQFGPYSCLNRQNSWIENLGRGTRWYNVRFLTEVEIWPFRACAMKKYALWLLHVAESPMKSTLGQIPCSTERISCSLYHNMNYAIVIYKNKQCCPVSSVQRHVPGEHGIKWSLNIMKTTWHHALASIFGLTAVLDINTYSMLLRHGWRHKYVAFISWYNKTNIDC